MFGFRHPATYYEGPPSFDIPSQPPRPSSVLSQTASFNPFSQTTSHNIPPQPPRPPSPGLRDPRASLDPRIYGEAYQDRNRYTPPTEYDSHTGLTIMTDFDLQNHYWRLSLRFGQRKEDHNFKRGAFSLYKDNLPSLYENIIFEMDNMVDVMHYADRIPNGERHEWVQHYNTILDNQQTYRPFWKRDPAPKGHWIDTYDARGLPHKIQIAPPTAPSINKPGDRIAPHNRVNGGKKMPTRTIRKKNRKNKTRAKKNKNKIQNFL